MHYVTAAEYISGYKIKITFEDGIQKIVDLSSHLDGPIFLPLKKLSYFKKFKVNHDIDTITWPNNADYAPEFLFRIGKPVREHAIV